MNFLNWSIDTKPQKIQDIGVTNEEEEDISCFPINNSTIFEKKNTMPRYFLSEEENRKTGKLCLFCRNPGHLVRDCREKFLLNHFYNHIILFSKGISHVEFVTRFTILLDVQRTKFVSLAIIWGIEIEYKFMFHVFNSKECPNERMKRYCSYCDSHEHAIIECTRVWRKYIFMDGTSDRKRQYTRMKYGCYNCGSGAHFGDVNFI